VDGYCTAPSAAYACDSHLLTNVSTAFQTTGSTKFWLSYWTIGAPIGADTWNADGITAGANAARFIDSGASAHKPDFVVLDPEGFGTQLQPSDPANWSAWVAGWATGVRSVDGTLKPALYASQGQIHQFQLYSVSQANNMALFPADGDLGNFALTPSVPLSQSAGYAAYYGQCPSARYVQEILSWGAQYNTIQFKGTPCAP
jgi:hypothetical protein